MAKAEDVSQLMTSCLDSSVLDLLANRSGKVLCVELASLARKARVMSGITLNAYSPALLGHSKYKGPAVFGVQVSVGKDKQALVGGELDVLLEVLEDVAGMELLDLGVMPDSGRHDPLLLEHVQVLFDGALGAAVFLALDADHFHASEEELGHRDHVVYQHLLELFFTVV